MELTQIGKIGKPHGTKGELKIFVEEHFEDDLLEAKAVFIGEPPFPYFVESIRMGGMVILQLEEVNSREMAVLLANKPLLLPDDQITAQAPLEDHPFLHLVGYTILAEGYPPMGPIAEVLDMPEHYLALLEVDGREIYIPLHEDLIQATDSEQRQLQMQLPLGLLEIDQSAEDEAQEGG